jgi:sporulation protein YlmC with PRC-barrel domain
MMRNVKDLRGYAIRATDGVIGTVDDFYFDDEDWGIRYLVVDTGKWLSGRKVLISPIAIGSPDWMIQELPVSLTTAQVKRSPDIDTRKPVSRQHEAEYSRYYGYPYYWGGAGFWGMGAYPGSLTAEDTINEKLRAAASPPRDTPDDCHLRSSNAVIGYQVHATDGDIGHIDDLLVDDQTWAIRYLVVNTHRWWSGRRVLVAPRWIDDVSWSMARVSVDLTRDAIKSAPPYDSEAEFDRQREQALHDHYDRPGYWTDPPRPRHAPRAVGEAVHADRRR